MSISAIQYQRKKDEFAQILVKQGIEPNNFELNKMLTEYFDNHVLGMPYYSPIKQKPYEESNKDDYNHNFQSFKEDIETAYDANIEANNKAVAMQEYYELEKKKVQNALARLALRVSNITEALKSNSNVKQHVEVFDDLYGVEFYGDTKRNIPYTTSFIDLLQKKVYTDKTCSKANKISMVNASIEINEMAQYSSYKTTGTLSNVLSDTLDKQFVIYALSRDTSEKTIEINIDIGSLVTINTVSFTFVSSKEMNCELYLSDDGSNYLSAYNESGREYTEWNFPAKTIRYVRIVCHKTEPDGLNNAISNENNKCYEYYYLLKNVSISFEEFENKSVFVSKIIDFNDLTSVIKLDATDMIFAGTRIDYFIGFDNEIDKIGWDAIPNHKDYQLFMFEKRHKILNAHIKEFGAMSETVALYKLYELPDGVNRNSIKVTAGYNMWSIKRYNRKSGDSGDDQFTLLSGDFTTLASQCNVTQLFMDCENYSDFNIQPNVLYVFTQYISLESPKNLLNNFIRITDPEQNITIDGAEIRVFLNGCEVTPIGNNEDSYSFALKKGVNKVQIAVYVNSPTVDEKRLFHNINFKALTNDVFACTPMKYTTNTILDKTVGNNYEYYTIKDNYIYVKCDPDEMIKSDLDDMGYFCTYYTLREDLRDYFKDNHIKFRIMAVLHSADRNVSPAILNYRLTGR